MSSPLLLCGYQLFTQYMVNQYDLPGVIMYSVGRLGRGCTLTRSCNRILSHTTASTCCALAVHICIIYHVYCIYIWIAGCRITACIQGRLTRKSAAQARWLACISRRIASNSSILTNNRPYLTPSCICMRLDLGKATKEPKRSHHSTRPIPSV